MTKFKKNLQLKPEFLERMKNLLPNQKDFQEYLEILKQKPAISIRCNTLKISPDKLKSQLENKGWKISQPWKEHKEVMIVEGKIGSLQSRSQIDKTGNDNNENSDNHFQKNHSIQNSPAKKSGKADFEVNQSNNLIPLEPGELGRSLEHLLGYYYIQELASMLPIIALNPQPNELVLDLCASPGSKTTQASALMKNTGTIIANEISMSRLKILASNLERCGCTNTIITRKDGVAFCQRIKKYMQSPSEANKEIAVQALEESRRKPAGCLQFDKILVDAPCSGEGTLRSTPQTYIMWNPNTIKTLSKLQKQLITASFEILKVGGEMIYSTCTHAPEENEAVVNFLLDEFKEKVNIESIKLPIKCRPGLLGWAGGVFNKELKKSCRIYPQDNNTEGFFLVKIKKIK